MHKWWISLVLVAVCASTVITTTAAASPAQQRAATAVATLKGWYNQASGVWNTTGWWNSANALTAVIQYAARTGDRSYDSIISNTFAKHPSFLNDYYDDEGWWALAWIEAYKYTKNDNYLNMAATIFKDITGGWNNTCGGGVWWSKARTYKNAIANELFFQIASGLYLQTNNNQYLTWATTEWKWFQGSGMINPSTLINDGLTTNCKNNNEVTWTYNQGVVLGGLVNMYVASDHNDVYLNEAIAIANAAIAKLSTSQGILHEPCEPNCGGDGPQFKGIFMRNLGYLYDITKNSAYAAYINKNSDSIWNNARNGNNLGLVWSGPFDSADAARQSSALDALNAALLIPPN